MKNPLDWTSYQVLVSIGLYGGRRGRNLSRVELVTRTSEVRVLTLFWGSDVKSRGDLGRLGHCDDLQSDSMVLTGICFHLRGCDGFWFRE